MKTLAFTILFTAFGCLAALGQPETLVFAGSYKGSNAYFRVPTYNVETNAQCVTKVVVNDVTIPTQLDQQIFEVKLDTLQLSRGDSVHFELHKRTSCQVRLMNIEDFTPPRPRIRFWQGRVENGQLCWNMTSNQVFDSLEVQQFRWNKWITTARLKFMETDSVYGLPVLLHSGQNEFRIRMVDPKGRPQYTRVIKYGHDIPSLDFKLGRDKGLIVFTQESQYEIYNSFGTCIKRGYGQTIDIAHFEKDVYYLNFDNQTAKFKWKGGKSKKQ